MASIAFPFWTLRKSDSSLNRLDDDVLAFSSAEAATAYLTAQLGGRGELKLVSRQSMRQLVTDFQRQKLTGLRVDPQPDGSGGRRVPLADLLAEFLS
jgi:hypothetical protein